MSLFLLLRFFTKFPVLRGEWFGYKLTSIKHNIHKAGKELEFGGEFITNTNRSLFLMCHNFS